MFLPLNLNDFTNECWTERLIFSFVFDQKNFVSGQQIQKPLKRSFFNHFQNPCFQDFQVHDQDPSCWLYAQPLKQAQQNCQTYTLQDNLIFNDRIILNIFP